MSVWKRTNEELPKDGVDILFKDSYGFLHLGYYDGSDYMFWGDVGTGMTVKEIVSWCPIPKYDLED